MAVYMFRQFKRSLNSTPNFLIENINSHQNFENSVAEIVTSSEMCNAIYDEHRVCAFENNTNQQRRMLGSGIRLACPLKKINS
jgi:hypothetical protein